MNHRIKDNDSSVSVDAKMFRASICLEVLYFILEVIQGAEDYYDPTTIV